jgi:predicted peroxiredoxin
MKRLYWIMGNATAAQRTSAFMMLIEAEDEGAAVTGCIKALGGEWASAEIDQIREIDPALSYQADETLREAIGIAQEQGFFLFLCDQSISN